MTDLAIAALPPADLRLAVESLPDERLLELIELTDAAAVVNRFARIERGRRTDNLRGKSLLPGSSHSQTEHNRRSEERRVADAVDDGTIDTETIATTGWKKLVALARRADTDTDQWYTPPWVFDALNMTFAIDVAAPEEPIGWIPALESFTEATDGLQQPWHGVVWCNPPYSAPSLWAERMIRHNNGLFLVRADLSTNALNAAFSYASGMWVPNPRLQFVNRQGETPGAVNFTSVVLFFGDWHIAGKRLAAASGTYRKLTP